jgi:hypothetical protein
LPILGSAIAVTDKSGRDRIRNVFWLSVVRRVPEQGEASVKERKCYVCLVVRGVSEGWQVAVASRLLQDEKTIVSIEEFSLVIAA